MLSDVSPGQARIYQAALRLFAQNAGSEIAITDLADAAGIARGTIYNNIEEPENLFGEVAAAISRDMLARTETTMQTIADPVERLATGVRLFVRRAHEDADWARFMVRFALGHTALQSMMHEPPARDVTAAVASRSFTIASAQIPAFVAVLSGVTLAAMNAVLRGEQTWRDAGSNAAEFVLRAAGIAAKRARQLASRELPPLAEAMTPKRKRRRST